MFSPKFCDCDEVVHSQIAACGRNSTTERADVDPGRYSFGGFPIGPGKGGVRYGLVGCALPTLGMRDCCSTDPGPIAMHKKSKHRSRQVPNRLFQDPHDCLQHKLLQCSAVVLAILRPVQSRRWIIRIKHPILKRPRREVIKVEQRSIDRIRIGIQLVRLSRHSR